nr:2-oxoglutarate and iron-dependent oxygenase JMJD4 [Helicoverpa armigera]
MTQPIELECSYDAEIPKHDYSDWSIDKAKFQQSSLDFEDFFTNFMLRNQPCIIHNVTESWKCAREWVNGDQINYDYMNNEYGDLIAPVADCNDIMFNSQCKSDMNIQQYIEYLKNPADCRLLYLKDWHLRRSRPEDNFYEVPQYFILDWLNEFAKDNNEDDFMFVYIGPKGSWTPLHEDVYCSYSWSVNILGRKKWILFPPGEEEKLKDKFGNLPLLFDPEKYHNVKYFEIVQEKGDALFVPSGWHHQVFNEKQTISINHNWINACNIDIVWKALEKSLLMVEHQIKDCENSPEYPEECQMILKSHFGMDFVSFVTFLCSIAKKRLSQLHGNPRVICNKYSLGISIIKFDLKNILKVMDLINVHPVFLNNRILCSKELEFLQLRKEIKTLFP